MDNGITVPAWSGRRAQQALEWVRQSYGPRGPLAGSTAEARMHGAPCVICGMRIDYSSRGKADSLTVEHVKPRRHYPHLTWDRSNHRPAHASCNYAGNSDRPNQSLGLTSI
ncbi:hypothetical protein DEI86_13565 [Curtobacterium sp. MCBD17_028]|nr:hypothetical protein DEI86_13565 [Curtobacterium sp. MCBD17_028]